MLPFESDYIPILNENVQIVKFSKNHYILCIDGEQPVKYKIGQHTKLLIENIDGLKTIAEIALLLKNDNGIEYSIDTILKVFNNKIAGYGILKGDTYLNVKVKEDYLKLRFTLVSEKNVQFISNWLLYLFKKKIFQFLFLSCTLLITFFYYRDIKFAELYFGFTSVFGLWFIALYIVSHFFHELGHAAACMQFGANSGHIGVGFYLLRPVFYADVTDVWRLRKKERVIVDIAGVYMQLIFCAVLIIIYSFTGNRFYLNMSFLISTTLIFHLNPFLRYDGYWALCDMLNVTNLKENSANASKNLFRRIVGKKNNWKSSTLNIFFVAYFSLSILFLIYFVIAVLILDKDAVLFFPVNLYTFFITLLNEPEVVTFEWVKWNLFSFIIPIVFYSLLFRFLKKHLVKLFYNK